MRGNPGHACQPAAMARSSSFGGSNAPSGPMASFTSLGRQRARWREFGHGPRARRGGGNSCRRRGGDQGQGPAKGCASHFLGRHGLAQLGQPQAVAIASWPRAGSPSSVPSAPRLIPPCAALFPFWPQPPPKPGPPLAASTPAAGHPQHHLAIEPKAIRHRQGGRAGAGGGDGFRGWPGAVAPAGGAPKSSSTANSRGGQPPSTTAKKRSPLP